MTELLACVLPPLYKIQSFREAKYPGDHVKSITLWKGDESGMITVQDYSNVVDDKSNSFQVGAYLPGRWECTEGDTPKTWPDYKENHPDFTTANDAFVRFVEKAFKEGWSTRTMKEV